MLVETIGLKSFGAASSVMTDIRRALDTQQEQSTHGGVTSSDFRFCDASRFAFDRRLGIPNDCDVVDSKVRKGSFTK